MQQKPTANPLSPIASTTNRNVMSNLNHQRIINTDIIQKQQQQRMTNFIQMDDDMNETAPNQ